MNEVLISILNVITMLWIIFFAGYLSAELSEQKIRLFRRVFWCIYKRSFEPIRSIKTKRIYLWCYALIPILIMNVLVISRQFKIGKMYIRADFSFITGALFWIVFPLFVIGLMKKHKQELKK